MRSQDSDDDERALVVPIEDEIDLHTFAPREVASVVREYLAAAAAKGFAEVRVVHGKGVGNLRRTVHAVLATHPAVKSFRLAGETGGSWGATIVQLKTPEPR